MHESQEPPSLLLAPSWSQVIEDVAHPAALLDAHGRLLRANALFAALCVGTPPEGHLLSEASPRLWQVLEPLLAQPGVAQHIALGERGDRFEYEAVARAIEDAEHEVVLWVSLRPHQSHALVEMHEAARVEEVEKRYRFLSDAIPQILWGAAPDGAVTYVNSRWEEYFGVGIEGSRGWLWENLLHPEDAPRAAERWAQSVSSREPYEIRYRLRGQDGRYRWFLGLGMPFLNGEGHVEQWLGTCTNIDASKQLEESLGLLADAGEILTSSLDESAPLQVLAQRLAPDFADWCCFERVLPGGRLESLALAHAEPEKLAILRQLRRHILGENSSFDIKRVLSSGRSNLLSSISPQALEAMDHTQRKYLQQVGLTSMICVPLMARGHTLGLFVLARGERQPFEEQDLNLAEELARRVAGSMDNAALYSQAQHALRAAEEAARAKDSFLATVSHELRTPLTAILGWANLLKSGRVDAETARNALETIERNVRAQAQIVEDLLDVSRIVAGQLRLEMRPVEFAPTVSAAIEAVRPAIDAKNIALRFVFLCPPDAPPIVSGDPIRLQQIVWNVLSNAVKFTPRGGRIEVSVATRGSHVSLKVSDSGPGVVPEFAPYLFDRFRQADSSSTRRHGGLGLGLAIVRHLAEMHGGSVRLEPPVEGQGATFVVELPVLDAEESHFIDKPASQDDFSRLMLQGRSVLVVEDEADSRELLRIVLARFGASVRLAESVAQAWQLLQEERPDVLISDIGMPIEDGYTLIRRVRAQFSPAQLPVVALTAYAAASDRERALEAGFNAHLTKPASPIQIAMTVAGLLEPHGNAST